MMIIEVNKRHYRISISAKKGEVRGWVRMLTVEHVFLQAGGLSVLWRESMPLDSYVNEFDVIKYEAVPAAIRNALKNRSTQLGRVV